MKHAGYAVTEVADAHEALQLVAGHHKVDVVLTDIRMPGQIDGWGLAMKMKAMVPPLKVICMTAMPDTRKAADTATPYCASRSS